jgi:hypothetical protein
MEFRSAAGHARVSSKVMTRSRTSARLRISWSGLFTQDFRAFQTLPNLRLQKPENADILINLTHVGRLDLPGRLPGCTFVVTPDVIDEIVQPDQRQQVEGALAAGILRTEELSGPETIALFTWAKRRRWRSPSI